MIQLTIWINYFIFLMVNFDLFFTLWTFSDSSLDVEPIIDFLNKISEVEALREIFCEKILSSVDTSFDNYLVSSNSSEVTSLVSCEASNGRKIIRSISTETNTIEMTVSNTCDGLGEPYKPNEVESPTLSRSNIKENNKQTFLQYLMEVLVKTEFPTQLATLLLQMLPNQKYKVCFPLFNFSLHSFWSLSFKGGAYTFQ